MRTINAKKLSEVVEERGENGVAELSLATGLSVSWFQKALSGNYDCAPRQITRRTLCRETGASEDELFPFKRESEAS